jgi:ElaB/YqjD/DUF883 family membrane-anchored ribosome-binding protein
MNINDKLIKNVKDEITRLTNQLNDLETYKAELSDDEIQSIRKDTLEQLVNNTKILEKMNTGDLTTNTEVDEARSVLFPLTTANQ